MRIISNQENCFSCIFSLSFVSLTVILIQYCPVWPSLYWVSLEVPPLDYSCAMVGKEVVEWWLGNGPLVSSLHCSQGFRYTGSWEESPDQWQVMAWTGSEKSSCPSWKSEGGSKHMSAGHLKHWLIMSGWEGKWPVLLPHVLADQDKASCRGGHPQIICGRTSGSQYKKHALLATCTVLVATPALVAMLVLMVAPFLMASPVLVTPASALVANVSIDDCQKGSSYFRGSTRCWAAHIVVRFSKNHFCLWNIVCGSVPYSGHTFSIMFLHFL